MPKISCDMCANRMNCRRKNLIRVNETLIEQFHYCFYGKDANEEDKKNAGIKRTLRKRVAEALAERCPFFRQQPEVK